MQLRATAFQLLLALAGACIIAAGLASDLHWLAALGLGTSACAELLGVGMVKLQSGSPALRLMQATGLALPSVAVATLMPLALLVAVAVVIEASLAGGVGSVLAARNNGVRMGGGLVRLLALRGANLLLLAAAAQGVVTGLNVIAGTDSAGLVAVSVGWAMLVALIAGVDATLALRRR